MPETDCINWDCPENCNDDHAVPDSGRLFCPETGDTWFYCSRCGDWDYENIDTNTTIGGVDMCDPSNHGYDRCTDCGVWTDDPWSRDSGVYCEGCDPGDEPEYDEYDNVYAAPVVTCRTCNTLADHFDLLREVKVCDHAAATLLQRTPTYPIKLSRELSV